MADTPSGEVGTTARRIAIEALERIEKDGAYANLLLPTLLEESQLDTRDRGFVTELVYGATRMKRALDYLVDRFIDRDDVDSRVRAALRVGAYQIEFMRVPAHAAVDSTVAATPKRGRGFVNAVLRKVAKAGEQETAWPTPGIELSYPDWILKRLEADLGDRAVPVLLAMNTAATTHVRDDGYRQDLASQQVSELITVDGIVLDLCAAPGGKATYIAGSDGGDGRTVIGSDLHQHRAGLIRTAAEETNTDVHAVVADATAAPYRRGFADAVLVDAPCSGLGSLRRRADARWRITQANVDDLAELQFALVKAAAELVKPGGQVVFSVCTLTKSESTDVDERIAAELPQLEPQPLSEPWEPWGRGGRLLPDTFAGDGMAAFRYRRAT